jgi:hypothetical protein
MAAVAGKLYYVVGGPAGLSTLGRLQAAARELELEISQRTTD